MRCLVVDDDELSRAVIEHFIDQHDTLTLIGSCESAVEAANLLRRWNIDLLFLDVEMPEMSGIEFVKTLNKRPQVILVTAKQDYALEAFDVDVTDFLLKPVSYARFLKAIERAERHEMNLASGKTGNEYVFIKSEGRLVRLDLTTVQWIEAQGDYVMFHTTERKFMVHATMKGLQEKLPGHAFVRVHRSFIVRLDQIDDIADTTIVMGRQVIPIGASFRESLLNRLKTI